MNQFQDAGWLVLPWREDTAAWANAAAEVARGVLADPAMLRRWLRHGGTWFVGVDALPNASDGSISGVALAGGWTELIGPWADWHPAQLSAVFPGYPVRDPDETEAAHRFRRHRDAAHLDGLIAEGESKRRRLREPHAFILGLPLTDMTSQGSPFVVWEGSHQIVGEAFTEALRGVRPEEWGDVDLTEIYQRVRQEVFATCQRVEVRALPGEAILCHRRAIHGMAPWLSEMRRNDGRMIAWFRPIGNRIEDWLRP
jgi:hypothetical protein